MDLEFSDEQEELRASVRGFLEKECPPRVPRAVAEGEGDSGVLWARMIDLGWPALTIPVEQGGIGSGPVELAIVCEELGRAAAPGPFLASVTQYTSILREVAGDGAGRLAALAAGERTGTLALAGAAGSWAADAGDVTASADGDGWRLAGRAQWVMSAGEVDDVAVVARVDGGVGVFAVPVEQVDAAPVNTLDLTRRLFRVSVDDARVGQDGVIGSPGHDGAAVTRAVETATVAVAAETVGVCQTVFDIALEHARTRHQFGVPIGSFQALKHRFADMLVALERARATCYVAALALAEDDGRRALTTSVAKAAAGDCQRLVAQEGIQILGGMGYTWEHDMHVWVKRAIANDAVFGNAAFHRQRVAALLLEAQ